MCADMMPTLQIWLLYCYANEKTSLRNYLNDAPNFFLADMEQLNVLVEAKKKTRGGSILVKLSSSFLYYWFLPEKYENHKVQFRLFN